MKGNDSPEADLQCESDEFLLVASTTVEEVERTFILKIKYLSLVHVSILRRLVIQTCTKMRKKKQVLWQWKAMKKSVKRHFILACTWIHLHMCIYNLFE